MLNIHEGESLLNLVDLNHIWTVITLLFYDWSKHQTEFCLVPNKSENGNYNTKFGLI